MATHSSILAWRVPWTEEPGGLQSAQHIIFFAIIHSLSSNYFPFYFKIR